MQEQISPEVQTRKHGNNFYVYLVAAVAAVGGFLFGYDLGIISSAMIFFKNEFGLNDAQLGTATGAAILGCILGPIFGGTLGDKLGRKKTLIIADKDAARLELARKLGVDGCIDISKGRTDEILDELVGGGDKVDVFYDCVGFGGHALNEIIRIARRGARVVVAGVLESGCSVPLLPDFVEHELTLTGSTMYVPSDFRDVLDFMARGLISVEGMISHRAPLMNVEDIYRMIGAHQEPYYKIIPEVD